MLSILFLNVCEYSLFWAPVCHMTCNINTAASLPKQPRSLALILDSYLTSCRTQSLNVVDD